MAVLFMKVGQSQNRKCVNDRFKPLNTATCVQSVNEQPGRAAVETETIYKSVL